MKKGITEKLLFGAVIGVMALMSLCGLILFFIGAYHMWIRG